jgi:hypothetical protein
VDSVSPHPKKLRRKNYLVNNACGQIGYAVCVFTYAVMSLWNNIVTLHILWLSIGLLHFWCTLDSGWKVDTQVGVVLAEGVTCWSISTLTGYGVAGRDSKPARIIHHIHTGSEAHRTSYPMGCGVSDPLVKLTTHLLVAPSLNILGALLPLLLCVLMELLKDRRNCTSYFTFTYVCG